MSQRYHITGAAEVEILKVFRDFITENCARHGLPPDILLDLKLAVDEACTNIIEHGYKGMDPGSIILSLRVEADRVIVHITDFGRAFEPDPVPRPDVEAALAGGDLGGFGLFLIYQTMDQIDYQASEEGNTLTFTKLARPAPPA